MPTEAQVPAIMDEVRHLLEDVALHHDVHLEVAGEKLEDDWLYIVVAPSGSGVRASDHARYMSQIEQKLRRKGKANVLLVPTLEE